MRQVVGVDILVGVLVCLLDRLVRRGHGVDAEDAEGLGVALALSFKLLLVLGQADFCNLFIVLLFLLFESRVYLVH